MKKAWFKIAGVLTITLLSVNTNCSAQKSERIFKRFKTDVSFGLSIPQVKNGNGGIGGIFVAEPKYAITDQWQVGLRLEIAPMQQDFGPSGGFYAGDRLDITSSAATIDYYFSNQKFRPFAGTGFGDYTVMIDDPQPPDPSNPFLSAEAFGWMLRAGFETGHFRLGFEYNFVGNTSFSNLNNYFGMKAGFCFGGGRKVQPEKAN